MSDVTYLDARPSIEVGDLDAALGFWTDVVGFEAEVVMAETVKVKRLVIAGFKGSFFHGSFAEKRRFVDAVSARYEALEAGLSGKRPG